MGLSLEKQQAAFYAFDQMMSKGTVTAEELKKQLGNAMPGAIKAAAMAYMDLHPQIKTIQEAEKALYAEMKKGAIDSATYVPLIVKNFQKLYGIDRLNEVNTLQASQNRLKNSWTDLVKSMNESETGGLTRFFTFFTDNLAVINKELTRFNLSWNNLFNKSLSAGRASGKAMFDNLLEDNKKSGLTEEKSTEMVLGFSRKKLLDLRKKEAEFVKALNSKDYQSKLSDGRIVGKDFIRKEREILLYEIGQTEEMIGLARKKLGLDKESEKPKQKTALTEKEIKAQQKAQKERLKSIEESNKIKYDLGLSNLEREKEKTKDLLEIEKTSLEDKLFLQNAYAFQEIQIAKYVYDEKIRLAKGNKNLEEIALNELHTATENALSESLKKQSDIKEKYLKTESEKTKEWYENNPPIFVETPEAKKAREDAKKQREEDLEDAKRYIDSFTQEFGDKLGFGETANFFLQMDADGRTMFDKLNDMADGTKEKQLATFQTIAEGAQEMFNFISNASQANYDQEYARLEKDKENALRFAGESESAKLKIEEDFQKRKKEIEKREFKAKQKIAMVNIAIDTAQAIMAVSAKAQWWQVPLMIALGAAQLAVVASQKIPEYWKGTDNAEAGLAWTNERGAEIVTDKKGHIKDFGDNKGARLTMMEKGDKVYTAEQTKRMMFDNELNSIMMDNGISNAPKIVVNSGISKADMKEALMETLGVMPQESTIIDVNGFKRVISNGHSKTITNNNRVSGVGIRV